LSVTTNIIRSNHFDFASRLSLSSPIVIYNYNHNERMAYQCNMTLFNLLFFRHLGNNHHAAASSKDKLIPPPPPPDKRKRVRIAPFVAKASDTSASSLHSSSSTLEEEDVTSAVDIITQSDPISERHVRFSSVQVRRHKVIFGDNPCAEFPLGLDWETTAEDTTMSVDDYDEKHTHPDYLSAQKYEPLSLVERMAYLRHTGVSPSLLRQYERKRRVQLAMEWSYRVERTEPCACTCPNAAVYIRRYIV
jgi:hypothetical protein